MLELEKLYTESNIGALKITYYRDYGTLLKIYPNPKPEMKYDAMIEFKLKGDEVYIDNENQWQKECDEREFFERSNFVNHDKLIENCTVGDIMQIINMFVAHGRGGNDDGKTLDELDKKYYTTKSTKNIQ